MRNLVTLWRKKRLLKRTAVLLPSGHYKITEVRKDDATGLAVTITYTWEDPHGE